MLKSSQNDSPTTLMPSSYRKGQLRLSKNQEQEDEPIYQRQEEQSFDKIESRKSQELESRETGCQEVNVQSAINAKLERA